MLKAWVRSIVAAAGLILFGFGTNLLTARAFGPEGRGIYAAVMLAVTLAGGISQLGLGQAYVFGFSKMSQKSAKGYLAASLLITIVVSSVIAALSSSLTRQNVLSAVLLSSTYSAYSLVLILAQVEKELILYNTAKILYPGLVFFFALLSWLLFDLTISILVAAQIVIATLVCICALMLLAPIIGKEKVQEDSEQIQPTSHFIYGLKYHSTVMLGIIATNIDKVYMAFIGPARDFGLYSVAFSTSRLMAALQETIATVLFSRFAGSRPEKMQDGILLAFRLSFLPTLAIALALGVLSGPFIKIAFGSEFSEAAIPLCILLVEAVIGGASWTLAQQFNATGRSGAVLLRQAIAMIPLVLFLPIIPEINLAIWLSGLLLLSSFIRLAVTMIMYKKVLGLPIPRLYPKLSEIVSAVRVITVRGNIA